MSEKCFEISWGEEPSCTVENSNYQRKNLRSEGVWHREKAQTMHFHSMIDL